MKKRKVNTILNNQKPKKKKQITTTKIPKAIKPPIPNYKPELKVVDNIGWANVSVLGTNPQGLLFGSINKGTSSYNRIGDSITIKKIEIKYFFAINNVLTSGEMEHIRTILVYDYFPNGVVSNFFDIISGWRFDGTVAATTLGSQLQTSMNRYKILYDEDWMSPTTLNSVQFYPNSERKNATLYKKTINCELPAQFYSNTNSGNIGDYQTGALYLFFVTHIDPTIWKARVFSRVFYEDV